jgi:hypothetical protein
MPLEDGAHIGELLSFMPRRTERTSVRSRTGSPKSPSESAIDLSLQQ